MTSYKYHALYKIFLQHTTKTKIVFFFAIQTLLLSLSCAKIDQEHIWNNPLDPAGTNFSPPQIITINDNVFNVYPVKEFDLRVTGTDDKDSIAEYFWSFDNGITWKSTGSVSHYSTIWDTSSIGIKKVLVYITDNHGLKSKIDTLTVFVHRYEPWLYPVNDTIVPCNVKYLQTLKGQDSAAEHLKYYWDEGIDGWDDSIVAEIASFSISKPEGGSVYVHWAIRDESNFVKNDTFNIYFNKPPTVPKMISPYNDTVRSFLTYDYYKKNGSIVIEYSSNDPDDTDSSLSFEVTYALKSDTNFNSISSRERRLRLEGLQGSSTYTWVLSVSDPMGNKSLSQGQLITPPPPFEPSGMRFIKCANVAFDMGQVGDSTTMPLHQVKFSRDFWIDTSEITVELFARVLSLATPTPSTLRFPVSNITWFDAVLFCNARSKLNKLDTVYKYTGVTGLTGSQCKLENVTSNMKATGFRLPTEAEWEFACRGGTYSLFYWGNDRYLIADYAWTFTPADSKVHEIALLKPNSLGLYDMAGNVWEWCNDWYTKDYYKKSESIDPSGPLSGTELVIRGGSSGSYYYFAQSGTRSRLRPDSYNAFTGFRTVLPVF
ncbi:MAG TPA: SUMF1/EgtB/PvdO family nonheme iron enzyme [Chitinispirillaceae bacterium]|nr:SUMF1/EgtB/PvdO family nonheme iron enzyme [Chitinispirillaceae bacterium]